MGMTIDKAICQVKGYRNIQKYQEDYAWSYPFLSSIDTLLKVADKYQKIEKIIKNAGIFAFDVPEIRRIAEVMKDGNDD